MICVAGYYDKNQSAKGIGDEIERLRAKGFAGCKFKVGRLTPEADIERLQIASAAAGSDFIITVDANQNWSAREAVRFGLLANKKNINLYWFEEPCKWESDKLGMELVRKATGIPVAAGQSEISAGGCRDLITSQSIDFCNFDASWGGGPTEWKRLAGLAHCFDVCMAHHEEAQISAHLLGSIPHGSFVELFDPERDPIFSGHVVEPDDSACSRTGIAGHFSKIGDVNSVSGVERDGHQVGDGFHVGVALFHPVAAGEARVEDAVLHVTRHLLRADEHAFDVGIVDGGKIRAAAGGDDIPGAAEQVDGGDLQAALGNAELQLHDLLP